MAAVRNECSTAELLPNMETELCHGNGIFFPWIQTGMEYRDRRLPDKCVNGSGVSTPHPAHVISGG